MSHNISGTYTNGATLSGNLTLTSGASLTNTPAGVISGSGTAVVVIAGMATVVNAGTIAGSGSNGYGIRFQSASSGGSITNQSDGVITGSVDAIYVNTGSGSGTVSNSGSIIGGGTGFSAINLSDGGTVTNASGGTISGHQAGVFIANGTGATVSNSGSIGASQA